MGKFRTKAEASARHKFAERSIRTRVQFLPCVRQELPLPEHAPDLGPVGFLRNRGTKDGANCDRLISLGVAPSYAVPDGAQRIRRERQDPASYFILYVAGLRRCP